MTFLLDILAAIGPALVLVFVVGSLTAAWRATDRRSIGAIGGGPVATDVTERPGQSLVSYELAQIQGALDRSGTGEGASPAGDGFGDDDSRVENRPDREPIDRRLAALAAHAGITLDDAGTIEARVGAIERALNLVDRREAEARPHPRPQLRPDGDGR